MASEFVKIIAATPPWLIKTAGVLLMIAAAIGPLLIVLGTLIKTFFILKTVVALLMGKAALGGLLMLLANPVVLAAVLAIGAAVGGAIFLWNRYKKTQEEALTNPPDMPQLPTIEELMRGLEGPTGLDTRDPLAVWNESIGRVRTQLERAVRVGDRWVDNFGELMTIQDQALQGMMANIGKTDEWAEAYARVYDEVTAILNQLQLMEVLKLPTANIAGAVGRASRVAVSDTQLDYEVAGASIQAETQLRLRERTLALANTFQATRVAVVEYAEMQRQATNDMAQAMARFKMEWSDMGSSMKSAGSGIMASLLASLGPVALLLKVFGAVLEGLMPFIDALLVPLVELGRVIGIMLTPILKILFIPLKYLAVIVAFLGEVMARVAAGISTAIGRAVYGIGKAIDSLPGISAKGIMKAGRAMLDFAEEQYRTADELKKARLEIMRLTFGDAQDSLNGLADAATDASEALLNIPTGFKIALERFRATLPGERTHTDGTPTIPFPDVPDPDPSGPEDDGPTGPYRSHPMGGGGARLTIPVMLDGQVIATKTVRILQERAHRKFGSTLRWAEVQD
jgi:hypothetical protein